MKNFEGWHNPEGGEKSLSIEERAREVENLRKSSLAKLRKIGELESEIVSQDRNIQSSKTEQEHDKRLHEEMASINPSVGHYEDSVTEIVENQQTQRADSASERDNLGRQIEKEADASQALVNEKLIEHLRPEADERNLEVTFLKKAIELRESEVGIQSAEFQRQLMGIAGISETTDAFSSRVKKSFPGRVADSVLSDQNLLDTVTQYIKTRGRS